MRQRNSASARAEESAATEMATFRIARPLQRLQYLHQLAMHEFVAADDVASGQCVVVAVDAGDDAAGFAHHDLAGRDVPGAQVALPIAVEAARGDEGHVERGGAEAAEAGNLVLQRADL